MTPVLLSIAGLIGLGGIVLGLRIRGTFIGAALRQGHGPDCRAFTFATSDGNHFALGDQTDKVILVVNTASRCGFTTQYAALEALWQHYRSRGLLVVAVPTNDFLRQEPGSDGDIARFCRVRQGTTFPLMSKITTRGPQAAPFYRTICTADELGGAIRWNFEKCLIDRNGQLRARIAPRVKPDDPRLLALIETLLDEDLPLAVH
jgi:glutathione peroxidase